LENEGLSSGSYRLRIAKTSAGIIALIVRPCRGDRIAGDGGWKRQCQPDAARQIVRIAQIAFSVRAQPSLHPTSGPPFAIDLFSRKETNMIESMLALSAMPVAAAGWAVIFTWLAGGGIGLFIILFLIFKVMGK